MLIGRHTWTHPNSFLQSEAFTSPKYHHIPPIIKHGDDEKELLMGVVERTERKLWPVVFNRILFFSFCGFLSCQPVLWISLVWEQQSWSYIYVSYSCKILLSVVWGKPKSITSSISSYTVTKLSRMLSSSSSLKYSLNTYRSRHKHKGHDMAAALSGCRT